MNRPAAAQRRASAPTTNDLKLWRGLISAAERAAKRPLGELKPLTRAAERARGAVMPVGHQDRDSAFNHLVLLGRRYFLMTGTQRQAEAAKLAELATACARALGDRDGDPQPAGRRARADIDG